MPDIEITKKKYQHPTVKIKHCGLPDIPRPYTIIFKTTVKDEFETVALTKEQYEKILFEIERGSSGVILNEEYHDRFSIYQIKKPR